MRDETKQHDYLSTYCYHGQHSSCRLSCKTCRSRCVCECHKENAVSDEAFMGKPFNPDEAHAMASGETAIASGETMPAWYWATRCKCDRCRRRRWLVVRRQMLASIEKMPRPQSKWSLKGNEPFRLRQGCTPCEAYVMGGQVQNEYQSGELSEAAEQISEWTRDRSEAFQTQPTKHFTIGLTPEENAVIDETFKDKLKEEQTGTYAKHVQERQRLHAMERAGVDPSDCFRVSLPRDDSEARHMELHRKVVAEFNAIQAVQHSQERARLRTRIRELENRSVMPHNLSSIAIGFALGLLTYWVSSRRKP